MNPPSPSRSLTLDDIVDRRSYEVERTEFRQRIIALKKLRRVSVGPSITLLFENRDTVRFQIQEMARVERIDTDAGVLAELDVYNPLIPEPGHLSATLFIELTDEAALREWLPRLVGVERCVELRLADGSVVSCTPDPAHEAQLTRDTVTSSVHYVNWVFTPEQVAACAAGPVVCAVNHPAYSYATTLGEATVGELLADLGPVDEAGG